MADDGTVSYLSIGRDTKEGITVRVRRLRQLKRILVGLMVGVVMTGGAGAGPLEDAAAAFQRGDYATSLKLWRPLAEEGNAEAQDNLGRLFLSGRGVPEDHVAAVGWLTKAANQGRTRAQVLLGFVYEGDFGVAADDAEAARWFAKAAEQGDLIGETRIANDYYNGRGVGQDVAEAARWYRKLADLGDVFSQSMLASIYVDGRGVGQDYAEAVRWYAKAADLGYADAQYHLGLLYRDGQGVTRDDVQAHKWLSLAAAAANPVPEATSARDFLAAKLTADQIAEAQRLAREWKPKTQP
jgi:hypothetical protein